MNFGRSKRESIRNGIYEIAAKFKGIILSDGENSALSVEVGTARDELGHVYGDFVPLVGISANQEVLSLKPEHINEHHDALVLIKESQNKQLIQIPLEIIWLKMISLLSERNQKPGTERFTDQMPIGIILNGGNLQGSGLFLRKLGNKTVENSEIMKITRLQMLRILVKLPCPAPRFVLV